MKKALFCLILALTVCSGALAQDSAYYKAIQKGAPTQLEPKQFKQIEQDALKNFSSPDSYDQLTKAFSGTTERVWGVTYGEVYCNLSSDENRSKQIGALVYDLYAKSLSAKGGNMSVDLTENAQVTAGHFPFESQFEMAFLMGTMPIAADGSPMTIKKLVGIRTNQLSLWKQKNFPQNELLGRLQAIISAGHFEAYNYWLFQGARPDEFNDWLKAHQSQYDSWLSWQAANKFVVNRPDFQGLYMPQH